MTRNRRSLLLRVLFFALLMCTAVGAQTAPAFRISGVVVDTVTGNPVHNAHLEASLSSTSRRRGQGGRQPSAVVANTDDSGRFVMALPTSGAWHLAASANGYVHQAYDEHSLYSSAVILTQTAPGFDLVFHLAPQGRVVGTILDEAGEGVRNATVELVTQPPPLPNGQGIPASASFGAGRRITQTDDRGAYEFAGLMPGTYRIRVQARPWYANAQRRGNTSLQTVASDLDVTYPPVWYPGVAEQEQATPIVLHPGDQQQADLQLSPVPALHLQIVLPKVESTTSRFNPVFPSIEKIDSNDPGQRFVSGTSLSSSGNQVDISGLTPGMYRVSLPGRDSNSAIVQISDGGTRSVDLGEQQAGLSTVNLQFDGDDDDSFMAAELVDPTTGRRYTSGGIRPMPLRMSGQYQGRAATPDLSIKVPSGRYEVIARGREQYLTRLSAKGADISGRFISVHGGDAVLTLHMAKGRAALTGVVSKSGKPYAGAFVMLVPAGLEDPGSFTTVVRDQTDTDGSFNLEEIIPGQYILIAVDHGWEINWSDPATLRRYLVQGTPLEIHSGATIRQNIDAQSP